MAKRKPKFRVGMKAILETGRIVELIGKEAPDLFIWRSLEHTAIGTVPRHLLTSLKSRKERGHGDCEHSVRPGTKSRIV